MAQSDFSLGAVTALIGAVTALVTAVAPILTALSKRQAPRPGKQGTSTAGAGNHGPTGKPATQTATPTSNPPASSQGTSTEPVARPRSPWPALACGLVGLALAFLAVGLRLESTTANITAVRVLAGASCIVTAVLGWGPLRSSKTDPSDDTDRIAGAGLLAGISACIAMLIVS